MNQKIVTRADCDNAIQACIGSDKFEVVTFKTKPFEDKDREYYKPDCILEVSAKISKNISRFRFFLKKFSTEYPALNELLKSFKASEREILFYDQYLPMLRRTFDNYETDFAADYLHGELDRLMIVEDMSLKFFTLPKKSNPHLLDRFHISLTIKAIAKLHAASLAFEEKQKDADDSRLFYEKDLLAQEPIWRKDDDCLGKKSVQSGIKGLKALLKEVKQVSQLDAALNKQIDDLVEKTFDIMKFQTKYRNVLGHGDLHTKNILFKYDKNNIPIECVLLNFGYCRYFLPAYDVLTMIFSSTNRLFRQHYFTYLIKYYYDCLHNELMKQELHINQFLTPEDYEQSINYLMPAIKLKAVLHLQDFGAKPGFYKLIQRDQEGYITYMYEDKSRFMLELYQRDPIFKDMIVEALEELLETLKTPQVSRENCYKIVETQFETTVYDLTNFAVSPIDGDTFELVLEVSEGEKEGEVNKYKYLVQCGDGNLFTVQNQLIE